MDNSANPATVNSLTIANGTAPAGRFLTISGSNSLNRVRLNITTIDRPFGCRTKFLLAIYGAGTFVASGGSTIAGSGTRPNFRN